MTSPFSDTESVTSFESADSVWSKTSSILKASSRTSLDSFDDNDDDLLGLSAEDIRQITENIQEIAATLNAAAQAHAEMSSALERLGEGLEALNAGLTDLTATAEANLESLREVVDTTARIEMQLPAFLERRRAMAQAEARRDARPGFFRSVVDRVKGRVWGWMAQVV
jgi:methyl-accepting chemotaxis protein